MATALAAIKTIGAVVATLAWAAFWVRKRAMSQKLETGIEKAKATGDTGDVEDSFNPPGSSER